MQIVAATWYAYSITGSATSIGLLSALALGPAIVGGPIGGALADRFDPRRLAVTLYVAQALPAIVMAALDLTGDLPLGWLYALTFAEVLRRKHHLLAGTQAVGDAGVAIAGFGGRLHFTPCHAL